MSRRAANHERRVLVVAALAVLPTVAVALGLLWTSDHAPKVRWTLTLLVASTLLAGAVALHERVVSALRGIANLLAALREGDYSVRGRPARSDDALGAALAEVNQLGETLARQQTGALEAAALLSKVMGEIDVAVFAFDNEHRLRLSNRAGERLLSPAPVPLGGAPAAALGLLPLLTGETPRTVEASFPGGHGPWEVRRSVFRLGGLPHELLVLTDVRRALRQEERQAWQRLVRVLGHEINNSLAPIRSIAEDLRETLTRPSAERPSEWEDDLGRGLAIIGRRSEALGRFMNSYARLAKLPPPALAPLDVAPLCERVVALETRLPVALERGAAITVSGDADQLEQALINLVRNAADAALETGGGVTVGWRRLAHEVEIAVADEGPGLANPSNLFVPFFTTKPAGTGIGLVLARQIAEAHGGRISLESRRDRARGAIARMLLPAA